MPKKFKSESHIDQRYSEKTKLWSFRVRYNGIVKSFNEKDYYDPKVAYRAAIDYRNKIMLEEHETKVNKSSKKISVVLEESFDLYPLREESKRKLRSNLNKYIEDISISKVDKLFIAKTLNRMVEIATDGTIQRVESIFKRVINYSLLNGYITTNAMLGIVRPKSHMRPYFEVKKDLDINDYQIVKSLCTRLQFPHDRNIVPLLLDMMYYTGMRPCEAVALEKDDVTDCIYVNKEIGSSLDDYHVVRQCKTPQSIRKIPLTNETREIVEKASKISKGKLLFENRAGTYFNVTHLGSRLHYLAKKQGINFNMYQLRHLFSTRLLRAGVDVKTIQCLMGHASSSMTIHYATSDMETMRHALENVQKMYKD